MSDTMMRLMALKGKGYPCSQMMMIMALEAQGQENPALVRAMAGLARGMGICSGACGALSAGACILALYAARGGEKEAELESFNPMLAQLNEWFEEKTTGYGGTLCHEITQGQAGSVEMEMRCGTLIADTYDRVMQLLVESGIDPEFPKDDDT